MASPTEEGFSKLPTSKRKLKEKSNSSNSLKGGSMSNSLHGIGSGGSGGGGGGSVSRMDVSDLPSFQPDHTSSDGKVSYVHGLKNHATEVNSTSSPVKGGKKKSGSESSASGSSGSQALLPNSAHRDSGSRRSQPHNTSGRSFSSGSSDGEESREEVRKRRLSRKTKGAKPSPLDSDDEATDSADEGDSGGEGRGRRRREEVTSSGLGLRRSNRSVSRKDSSESTNSATSPVLNNPSLATSTIFVESALPKDPVVGASGIAQPSSPVNMAVGYGAADAMAPPSVFDKTPAQSPLGTPTLDSPKPPLQASHGRESPGTPIHISPSPTPVEVRAVEYV